MKTVQGVKKMHANDIVPDLSKSVAEAIKGIVGDRLRGIVLFGSYARGDYDAESDVDFFVIIDCPAGELSRYSEELCFPASRLSLKYGVSVSISVADLHSFSRYKRHLPFYENIEREGIRIA